MLVLARQLLYLLLGGLRPSHKHITIVHPFAAQYTAHNLYKLFPILLTVFSEFPGNPNARRIQYVGQFSTAQLFSNFAQENEWWFSCVSSIWWESMALARTLPDDSRAFWVRCVGREISTDACYMCSTQLVRLVQSWCTESIGMWNLSSKRQRNALWYWSAAGRHVRWIPSSGALNCTISVVPLVTCCKCIEMENNEFYFYISRWFEMENTKLNGK